MIKSYIKIAARSFSKNRLVSFINIFGLGLSMSVGMMVMIRMQDQFSYDNFHPHPGRTYRITSEYAKKNGEQWKLASTPLPINEALAKGKDNVESAVNIYPAFNGKAKVAGKEIYLIGAFTEPSFFDVFGFSLLSGDPGTALQLPNSIVINRSTAEKFFGKENPLGKVISMENVGDFIIKGVMNDIPGKSHINYDAYASYSSVAQLEKDKLLPDKSSDWYAFNTAYTYVLLKKNVHASALSQQLNFIANDLNKNNKEGTSAFSLQRIDRITPGSDYLNNDIGRGTSWGKIYFEIGMSLLILLAACFNYTNLTIARALTRAKEVGIRKIVGAKRFQVFTQCVIESVLLVLLALSFAWLILSFVIHYAPFNDDYEFIPSSFQYNIPLVFCSIGFALFTGILAGVAPAWILSSFKPLQVLKNLSTARILGKVSLQKVFIVFQYSLSLTIIIFLFAFYRQFAFMAKADPGFKKDNVLVLPLNGLDAKIAMQKIGSVSGVTSVAAMSSDLGKRFQGMNAPVWISDKKNAENASNLVQTMGVKDMSAIDLNKFLAGKTVTVQPYINPYDEGMQGSSSVKDFETFLQLIHLYFTAPRKDAQLFTSYINTQKGFLKNLKSNPNSYFADTVARLEYNNNPWAPVVPDASDFDKISLDRSFDIYKEIYSNAYGWHFTFVGNIDVAKMKPLLEMYLGSLPSKEKENKFTDEGLRPVKGKVEAVVNKGAAKQSRVRIIFTGDANYSPDENLKLNVLMAVLNIKIIEKLREEMSGIYGGGMNGTIIKRPYNHYAINASFPCGPENVDKLTAALFGIIKNAKDNGVEQKDLDKVKETLKKQNDDQLTQNDHWLDVLTRTWIERDDPNWIYTYSKKVAA